jgi:hypothetical protein
LLQISSKHNSSFEMDDDIPLLTDGQQLPYTIEKVDGGTLQWKNGEGELLRVSLDLETIARDR